MTVSQPIRFNPSEFALITSPDERTSYLLSCHQALRNELAAGLMIYESDVPIQTPYGFTRAMMIKDLMGRIAVEDELIARYGQRRFTTDTDEVFDVVDNTNP